MRMQKRFAACACHHCVGTLHKYVLLLSPSQSVALVDSSVCVVNPAAHLMQLPLGSFGLPPGDQLPVSHGLGCFDLASNCLRSAGCKQHSRMLQQQCRHAQMGLGNYWGHPRAHVMGKHATPVLAYIK